MPGWSESTQSTKKIDLSDKVLSQIIDEENDRVQCAETRE